MRAQLLPFILLLISAALPAALALHVYRRGSGRGVLLLVVLLLAMSGWALAYALELVITDPAGKVFWTRAKLAGALALPPLWVGLSLSSTGRPGWLDRRTLAALVVLPAVLLVLAWTGERCDVAPRRNRCVGYRGVLLWSARRGRGGARP